MRTWLILILISTLIIATNGLITTSALENTDTETFQGYAFCVAFILTFLHNIIKGNKISFPLITIFAGICLGFAKLGQTEGIKMAPNPGLSIGMYKIQLIILTFISVLFFKSKIYTEQIIGLLLSIVGAFLISNEKQGVTQNNKYWYIPPLIGGLFVTGNDFVMVKQIRKGFKSVEVLMSIFGFSALTTMSYKYIKTDNIYFSVKDNKLLADTIMKVIISGICLSLGVILLGKAMAISPNPGVTKAITTLSVLLTAMGGIYFFDDTLGKMSSIGIILLVIGVILLSLKG